MKKEKKTGNLETWKVRKAVMGLAAVLVVAAAVWGLSANQKAEPEMTITVTEATEEIVQKELPVSEKEEELLSNLYGTMVTGSYADTARILNENEEDLKTLLSETLGGKKYCYWEKEYENETVIRSLELLDASDIMEGMVITRFNTVFYGTFVDGKPEGECHAIQAMVLDEPRYTYAEGLWKNGKMNGDGKTGYHYYLNPPSSGFVMTEKAGTYSDNLLDGTFLYRTESAVGEKLSWEIEAENGVTVLTDKWTHYPLRKEYMLGAKEDSARAYVLTEERAEAMIWNNLITWDE